MRIRTALIASVVAVVSLSSLADAAPPKNFKKTVTFTDGTPDPSGNAASGNENHCNGKLPQETPISVKIPGPGTLEVSIGGFQGDWTLQVKDKDGEVLAGADVNPPSEFEAVSVRFKKAETVGILPCNLAGTPQAEVTYSYTYRKK
jgi:hypothetical protein